MFCLPMLAVLPPGALGGACGLETTATAQTRRGPTGIERVLAGCCRTSRSARGGLDNKNDLVQNARCTEAKKPSPGGTVRNSTPAADGK